MKEQTACYLRVSSRNGRQRCDAQKLALKRHCRSAGFKNIRYYEDRKSGKTTDREQFQTMLDHVKAGKIARVVVWKLDRLSRGGLADMLDTIATILRHKTTIIVTSNNLVIDGHSPFNDFLIGLFGLLGKLEISILSERIKSGLDVARANGKRLGAPTKDRLRARVQKWTDNDVPVSTMAKRLNISRQAVYSLINRMKVSS